MISNLIRIEKEEQKQIALSILQSIAIFCENNNINYILSDGTLLGAVRHKGFIPWDADIDISMLRSDYNKFIDLWNKNQSKNFFLVCKENDKDYPLPFAKVVDMNTICFEHGEKSYKGGLWVDIFPLDAVPASENEITSHFIKMNKYFNLYSYFTAISKKYNLISYYLRKIKYSIINKDLLLLMSNSFFYKRYMKSLISIPSDLSINVNNYVCIFRKPKLRKYGFPKDCVLNYTYEEFEGHNFRIPKDYDSLLKSYYDNYMELPPVEQRVDTHGIEVYFKG